MNIENASTENKSDINENSIIYTSPNEKGRNTKATWLLYKLPSHNNVPNENELNTIKNVQRGKDMNKLMKLKKTEIAEGNKGVYIDYEK